MSLNASKQQRNSDDNKKKFNMEPLEPGVYPTRLVQIIDLGLQPQRPYQGKDKPPAHEIMMTYEFVDEFLKDEEGKEVEDKPRWYSETLPLYSLEADKAKSTQRYNALDPDHKYGGDFVKTLGTPVNVTIVHNKNGEKLYVNIANTAAMRPRDADKCPPLVNTTKVFDLDDPSLETLGSLPQWIQDKIKGNLQFKGSNLETLLGASGEEGEKKENTESKPSNDDDELPW